VSPWLAAAYGALALGLAWALTGSASWRRRMPYIVCAPPLALALWLGRPDAAGWPSVAKAPAHAQLVWASIDEPDPSVGDKGHIYLWLDVGSAAPRAYALPYSRALHKQVQKAMNSVKQGRPIGVGRAAPKSQGRPGHTSGQHKDAIHFYPHPSEVLPPKTH
jgi:hypothetical protein